MQIIMRVYVSKEYSQTNPHDYFYMVKLYVGADDFDAHFVDGKTVRFGPQEAQAEHWALEDVDDDGDEDMILHFRTQDTGIRAGDTKAELVGQTLDGREIHGSDSVWTVPPWDDE